MSFDTPRYSYGGGAGRYVMMEVVDVDDPKQMGRVRCRIIGYQDDESRIPEEQLHWAMPKFPVNNPMNGGIGGPVTGLMKKSICYGFFADGSEGQMLTVDGTTGKGQSEGENGEAKTDGRNHDTPPHARDERVEGSGDKRWKTEDGEHESGTFDKPITEYAVNEAKDTYGGQSSKEGWDAGFSLANLQYA